MQDISAMKRLAVARFELGYQLRRWSTWVLFALFLIPLIGVASEDLKDAGGGEILFNAPMLVAQNGLIMGLIALLVLAGVAGDAATRDVQTRMEPLMHTAPIGRAAYLGGRFIAAFTVAAMLLATVPLVRMLVPLVSAGVDAEFVGPLRPAAYLQSYFVLILPNALIATALMFALATLVRHTLGSYLGAALVFAGAQGIYGVVGELLGRWNLAKLLDPTGIVALDVMTRTWPPVDLNARLVGLDGGLLWNRLLWLAVSFALLSFTYTRFRYGASGGEARWWRRVLPGASSAGRGGWPGSRDAGRRGRRPGHGVPAAGAGEFEAAAIGSGGPVSAPRVPRDFGAAGRVRQTLATTRDSLREIVTGWAWLVLPFLVLRVVAILARLDTMGAGTPVLPTTGLVLAPFEDTAPPVVLFMIFLPVLFAGELFWRERDAHMEAMVDVAPVPNGVRFAGKVLGLWLVIVAFLGLLMLAGVASQIVRGWYDFDFGLYFQILFGLDLIAPLAFALFAMSLHVMVNHKHVGHVLVMLLLLGPLLLAEAFRIEHPLLRLGWEPSWRHSPISGFGPFVGPVLAFNLYWAAWTLLLALVARLFWVRGVERGLRERLRIARRRFVGRTVGAMAAAVALVLLSGGFIFYNTNVLNEYDSSAEIVRRRADYELRYGQFGGAPQPRMIATELNIEIYPDQREADVRGVHRLVNLTPQPIDTIHVTVSSEVETGEVELVAVSSHVETDAIELGRPARAALVDDDLGHRIYVLNEPLQPGDSLRMSWQVRHDPRGLPARGISTAVVENGSFILMPTWTPLIGYQPRRQLAGAAERREHGLPPRPVIPSLYDLRARHDSTGRERIELEVTVGTAADQIAVAPGRLLRTWTSDGRRYFQYATAAPIGNEYAIFSARYAVRSGRWNDVALEILHHPAHDRNVERMMRGMEASLEQFTERFGPYPYEVLRMIEYPSAGGSLHAEASAIWYQELFSLFDTARDPRRIDLPFAVTAHEVAHQWWGSQGARVEGIAMLSESLAWFSALGVIEQEYGTEHLARFLGFMRESYLTPRSRAGVPLLRAADSFLAYRRGPFAMYALREYVGQERVDTALRGLRARYASPEPPFATSLDLYRELQQVTADSLQYLLGDLFERNTFWELETGRATAEPTRGGEWRVSLEVEARKVVVDTAGAETDVPMDDLIEIGVYAAAEAGEERGRPLYLAMHRVRTGPQTITLSVPGRPALAGIDPRHLLIDVQPGDNLMEIQDPSRMN